MPKNKKQNKVVESWEREFNKIWGHLVNTPLGRMTKRLIRTQLKKAREETLETEIPKIQKELMKDYERDIAGAREEEREKHLKYLEKQLRKGIKNLKRDRECLPN